ncbi:MAG: hypothetical protein SWK76_09425 [Actinomycetota bacterium]|nr:hypothetical protein [Actinomycetota bacterium]
MTSWSVKKKLLVVCMIAIAAVVLLTGIAVAASQGTREKHSSCDGEGRGGEGDNPGKRGVLQGNRQEVQTVIAVTLGITTDELRDEMREGKTIADIAAERGASTEEIAEAATARIYELIDGAVAEGDLDADTAEDIKSRVPDRVAEMMVNTIPRGRGSDGCFQDGRGGDGSSRPDGGGEFWGKSGTSNASGNGNGRKRAEK